MKYGNCLIGAIILMIRFRTWKVRIMIRPKDFDFPYIHSYVLDKNGNKWHYKCVADIMPWPLGIWLFHGKFTRFIYGDSSKKDKKK